MTVVVRGSVETSWVVIVGAGGLLLLLEVITTHVNVIIIIHLIFLSNKVHFRISPPPHTFWQILELRPTLPTLDSKVSVKMSFLEVLTDTRGDRDEEKPHHER